MHPLSGLRVVAMGAGVTVPYLAKLFVDAGASVTKVESPAGDPLRRVDSAGNPVPDGEDSAFFRYLNAGTASSVVDLETEAGRAALIALVADADLVLDDHVPADAARLEITTDDLRAMNPAAVVVAVTAFGRTGPWADRPANDFTLQALTGATEARGVPGEEPAAVGGQLGDFVAAAVSAPAVLASTLAAVRSGSGVAVDASRLEAMLLAFQTFRQIFDAFAPHYRQGRQVEVPSVEPALDGHVGYCCITGQQWQDFCAMVGEPAWADDPDLGNFDGRMAARDRLRERIAAFTSTRTVAELVELAVAFRIPVAPIGTGDVIADLDHFAERHVFVDHPQGFVQPRPPYRLSASEPPAPRPAPAMDEGEPPATPTDDARPALGTDPTRPLAGLRVVDLSAFLAGPVSTNLMRALGADLVKVESHVRLDGMRWASGLQRPLLWEWSPVYHGANVGKRVINLDLNTTDGMETLWELVEGADLVVENFSPRVTEDWGLTWEAMHERNPRTSFLRVPAFGLDGPWRDRVGFAMTMEQVSGMANRTGHPDGVAMVPRGPVDTLAGMHAVFAAILALAERERTGLGQLIEAPLVEGALQAAAEQVVAHSADALTLHRMGNRSAHAHPQGLYPTALTDQWLALSVETDEQWEALVATVGDELADLDRRTDADAIDEALRTWTSARHPTAGAAALWTAGVPAAPCVHANDASRNDQLHHRGWLQWRDHPVTGWTPYPSYPFHIDGSPLPVGDAAPTLGQHTDDILRELGRSDAQIMALHEAGVTGDWPAMVPR